MANEHKKDFNAMLLNNKDMPKIQTVSDERTIKIYGGTKMFFAPPLFYDEVIKQIPKGKLTTIKFIRETLAKQNNADFTDPMTAGIFVQIVAWASYQRSDNPTPFWRVLKTDGELNPKFPEGVSLQKELLKKEGFTIIEKGKTAKKYYVKDYEKYLFIPK